ncbi:MAG TPA: hypothetical protein VK356_02260, partial [Thermomicrobiales bacterium]|nr:hypothetical protein [Thermomicrobiales bacterium]
AYAAPPRDSAGAPERAGAHCYDARRISGAWSTGKFTEFAMKHFRCASSCSAKPNSESRSLSNAALGRETTSENAPRPYAMTSSIGISFVCPDDND